MKEKSFYPLFREINNTTGVFEIKLINLDRTKSFAFKLLEEHQIAALLAISSDKGLSYKIPDGWNRYGGMSVSPKPCDIFFLKNTPAYLVLIWYQPRKLKEFHYIKILDFLKAKQSSKRKSLTYGESKKIASLVANT